MPMGAQGRRRGMAVLILKFDARWGWVTNTTLHVLPPPLPPGKTQHKGLDGSQGQSRGEWRRESLSLPLGFEIRTAQLYRLQYPDRNILKRSSFFHSLSTICFHRHGRRVQHRTAYASVIL